MLFYTFTHSTRHAWGAVMREKMCRTYTYMVRCSYYVYSTPVLTLFPYFSNTYFQYRNAFGRNQIIDWIYE
jgi:hypothetical protein